MNPTPTPNSPDRNELRDSIRTLLASDTTYLIPPGVDAIDWHVDTIMGQIDAHMAALQQTIEAEAEPNPTTPAAAPELVLLSTITRAFNAARGREGQ